MRNPFLRTVRDDFVVIDSHFPQKNPFAFRNTEINEYIKRISNFTSYTMYPMQPDSGAWFRHGYGMSHDEFRLNLDGYIDHYPNNKNRVKYLEKGLSYRFKLAYSFFLGETYVLLPFYEKHKIPFVFVLYPGGCFDINVDKCDEMLRKIFRSPYFRGVIATQEFTRDYLVSKRLCDEDKIAYIYGSFAQFVPEEVRPKKLYLKDKDTFDICFVAAKYSEKGVDKGYDLFIETAKKLYRARSDIMFHVVGGFGPEDIDVSDIAERITFYGYQRPDFLLDFYSRMDIFLSPNRPFKISAGNFDGFPLGADAAYCGAALFVSDELHLNRKYVDGKDIVIIPLDSVGISDLVLDYYDDTESLYSLAALGQAKTQELFDTDFQINERVKLFKNFVDLTLRSKD